MIQNQCYTEVHHNNMAGGKISVAKQMFVALVTPTMSYTVADPGVVRLVCSNPQIPLASCVIIPSS